MIKAVIFDLDGTLLNTLEDLKCALNYSLEKFNYPPMTVDDVRRYIGNGIKMLITRSVNHDMKHVDEMNEYFKEYYVKHCNDYTKPYDGILSLLYKLKNEGYHLGLISNKAKYALSILNEAHFDDLFEIVIGDMEGIKRKPDIESLEICKKKWNLEYNEMVYVGDSEVDITFANNAGCHIISVDYGFRDLDVLVNAGAKYIARYPNEIYEYIKKIAD